MNETDQLPRIDHFVGKRYSGAASGFLDVYDPARGRPQRVVPVASQVDVDHALSTAVEAQRTWAAVSPQRRVRVLMRFLDLVHAELDELAALLSAEHGKTLADSRGDIERGLDVVEFCCGAPHLLKGESSEDVSPGIDVRSIRQPVGVVVGITPFNFPAMIPLWIGAPALAAGNAFVLKPSERDPSLPVRLAELFQDAGATPGAFTVLHGNGETVESLIADRRTDAVSFVGSTRVAEQVYALAASNGKRVQCFGGAKNHLVVLPDADLEAAADALIGAAFGSAGQRCMAHSVVVAVGDTTADELRSRLVQRMEELHTGPWDDERTDVGPLVTGDARDRALAAISLGVDGNAELVVDGRDVTVTGCESGFFVGPCLFDRVEPGSPLHREEIFGPVLSMIRVGSYEDALRLPSEHEYGNGVSVYTSDGAAARDFASRVSVGMVGVNVPIPVPVAHYTFGGWKRSSFGDLNQHGADAFRFCTNTKTITSRWSPEHAGVQLAMPTTS